MERDESFYEKLPDEFLCTFYREIKKNIEKGLLIEAMYHEIELIKKAAKKRSLTLVDLDIENKSVELIY